jgi:hypothetical protein
MFGVLIVIFRLQKSEIKRDNPIFLTNFFSIQIKALSLQPENRPLHTIITKIVQV